MLIVNKEIPWLKLKLNDQIRFIPDNRLAPHSHSHLDAYLAYFMDMHGSTFDVIVSTHCFNLYMFAYG